MRVPIVPAAAVFDLGRGGDPGATPDAEMGYRAAASARSGEVTTGVVGAGTGTTLARATLKGGVGTASIHLPGGLVVGALAVANAFGSPFDAVTGDLLGRAFIPAGITRPNHDPAFAGRLAALWQRLSPANVRNPAASGPVQPPTPPANTTLAVVATNAALDPARARRTSTAAHDGLARAFCPVHTLLDGDAVFTLATGEIPVELPELVALQAAAADAVLLAILDALLTTGG
jgi:putative pantetheine hydrolase